MTNVSSPVPPAPSELAAQWHALAEEWARWYAKAASEFTGEPLLGSIANLALAPFPTTGPVDVERLVALNEKYRPRWETLWSAAIDAAAAGGLPEQPLPDVANRAPGDRRFAAREWRELPFFALMKQGYLLLGEYLGEAALLAPLPEPDKQRLLFLTKQSLDALAPTNFIATNPDALKRALSTEGASLLRGIANLAEDARRGRITMSDERAFEVGRNLAVTPGSVVYRNDLIELIQYAPTTARVHRRPLVIVPPCINKYYILDLQPENSFVRWAVGEGHTVFMISWRNIPPELGRLTWDDYIEMGVLRAIAAARQITGSRTVNTLGFCVGGTLLACALAVLAARGDRSVASVTLLTTMLDFADPGEIGVYVSREMLAARKSALMGGKRMQGSELAGAFASLRANELIWNYVVSNYLKGETPPAFDLLYWNGDSSNLPGPMCAYYLEQMYLDNKLRERGALTMAGASVDLARVTMPACIVASREDHIVPWRSAYQTTRLLGGDVTFVLGASGHIAGVVNPPAKNRRNYWTNPVLAATAEDWLAHAETHPGSWWPHWGTWLAPHGGKLGPAPRAAGSPANPPLYPAPGRYVLETPE
ncbi:MAG: class I poly(R)-hydroxyalkanoic acid synthase [Betaproteobacteria bacterium]|nr:class I poly(R)-hydroxyalkanoic acid synthase [Betaproteobacteria bacterium]